MNTHIKNATLGIIMGTVAGLAIFAPSMGKAGSTVHVTYNGTNYGTGNNKKFVAHDMVTQAELNRVDQEDHRVVGGSVSGDTLTLRSQDMDGGSKRTIAIDVSSLKGQDGTNGTNGQDGNDGNTGTIGATGATGDTGSAGAAGASGEAGATGSTGATGATGATGSTGQTGLAGSAGQDGRDAVAPLGSLSFAAASASFYGDGMGFGLSNSNYGSLEGSIVFGFDLDNDWRVVAGITTDFKGKVAGSVGVGVSF